MNAAVPPALAAYVQQCIGARSLTLLTSVLETPTTWLVAKFLAATLANGKVGRLTSTAHSQGTDTGTNKVVLVSIWRSLDTWTELARRSGLNLQDAFSSGSLCYVDGMSTSNTSGNVSQHTVPLKGLTMKDLDIALLTAIGNLSTPGQNKIIIVFDGLDFLLAAQPNTTSIMAQQMLLELQSRVHGVIVTCAADSALLHSTDAAATPLELDHTNLTRVLAYQAQWLFQLQPLETGQSKDVNGSIRVSRGGAWESTETTEDLEEGEWLFQVKGDGRVKVWGRGET